MIQLVSWLYNIFCIGYISLIFHVLCYRKFGWYDSTQLRWVQNLQPDASRLKIWIKRPNKTWDDPYSSISHSNRSLFLLVLRVVYPGSTCLGGSGAQIEAKAASCIASSEVPRQFWAVSSNASSSAAVVKSLGRRPNKCWGPTPRIFVVMELTEMFFKGCTVFAHSFSMF